MSKSLSAFDQLAIEAIKSSGDPGKADRAMQELKGNLSGLPEHVWASMKIGASEVPEAEIDEYGRIAYVAVLPDGCTLISTWSPISGHKTIHSMRDGRIENVHFAVIDSKSVPAYVIKTGDKVTGHNCDPDNLPSKERSEIAATFGVPSGCRRTEFESSGMGFTVETKRNRNTFLVSDSGQRFEIPGDMDVMGLVLDDRFDVLHVLGRVETWGAKPDLQVEIVYDAKTGEKLYDRSLETHIVVFRLGEYVAHVRRKDREMTLWCGHQPLAHLPLFSHDDRLTVDQDGSVFSWHFVNGTLYLIRYEF